MLILLCAIILVLAFTKCGNSPAESALIKLVGGALAILILAKFVGL